jgi:hypothetical protein
LDQEELKDRLAAILRAGGIKVTDDEIFALWEGITPEAVERERREDWLMRQTGIGSGLKQIVNYYLAWRDDRERGPRGRTDWLDAVGKKAEELHALL